MRSTPENPPPPPDESLSLLCLEQLAREEAHLEAALAALQDVRAALLSKDHAALGVALVRHDATARAAAELTAHRDAFRQQAGAALGVPAESVTLDRLAERLPGAAEPIAAARARLRQQAAEVERLNASNASLLYYCLDFLQRFFERLTGRPRDGRYGPAGKLAAAAGDSLINARG
jgi:hypothetical protein